MKHIIFASLLILAGCASTDRISNTSNTYSCDNARQLIASINEQGTLAGVTFEGKTKNLALNESKREQKFSDGVVTLTVKEDVATLYDDGFPIYTNCQIQ